jgi:hypothetical protein
VKLVVATEPGVVELNYMWMPTWLGINPQLKKDLEGKLQALLIGQPLTDALLDQAHDQVLQFLVQRHPQFDGLRDYLDALKFVCPQT